MNRWRTVLGSPAVFTPVLLACYAITAVIHLAATALNTLLPFHVVALGGTPTEVGLLFSVTTAVSMVLRPAVGGWVDRFGVRPVVLPGMAALAITSLVLHLADSAGALIVLMAGVGIANGLVSTSVSVLTARSSGPAHRGEALGTYYLATSLAVALAPPVGFGLRALGGMPLAFAAVTVLALAMAAFVAWLPPAPPRASGPHAPHGLRLIGVTAIPTSFALVLATVGHSSVYGFLPLHATSRGQGAALALFFTVYPTWLIGCRTLLRGLSDRVGRGPVALASMALVALAYLILALPPSAPSLVAAAIVLGTGAALLYPTLAALVVDRAPEPDRGLALGTLSGSWDLGVVLGSALIGWVAARISYGAAFAVGGLCAALGVGALALAERRHAVGQARRDLASAPGR